MRSDITWRAVLLLILVHAVLLAHGATRHSPTMLEPAALVAGISHWQFGRFELYRVNPPLVRMVAALPVLATGYEADWKRFYEGPGVRPEFAIGNDFTKANGERSIWLFTIARWACIPFRLIGALICFLWARELWGRDGAGLIAPALWCFEPSILAHGELINTDCAATSLGLGAGYFFWRWLKRPGWDRAFLAGLFLGLAELTKTTWVILLGLWPVLWIVWRWRAGGEARGQKRDREKSSVQGPESRESVSVAGSAWKRIASRLCLLARRQNGSGRTGGVSHQLGNRATRPAASMTQLAFVLLLGVYLINVGYAFEGSFTRLSDFTFVSRTLAGGDSIVDGGDGANRFPQTWLGRVPVPLPANYVRGIDLQKADFERVPSAHSGKFRGK